MRYRSVLRVPKLTNKWVTSYMNNEWLCAVYSSCSWSGMRFKWLLMSEFPQYVHQHQTRLPKWQRFYFEHVHISRTLLLTYLTCITSSLVWAFLTSKNTAQNSVVFCFFSLLKSKQMPRAIWQRLRHIPQTGCCNNMYSTSIKNMWELTRDSKNTIHTKVIRNLT